MKKIDWLPAKYNKDYKFINLNRSPPVMYKPTEPPEMIKESDKFIKYLYTNRKRIDFKDVLSDQDDKNINNYYLVLDEYDGVEISLYHIGEWVKNPKYDVLIGKYNGHLEVYEKEYTIFLEIKQIYNDYIDKQELDNDFREFDRLKTKLTKKGLKV